MHCLSNPREKFKSTSLIRSKNDSCPTDLWFLMTNLLRLACRFRAWYLALPEIFMKGNESCNFRVTPTSQVPCSTVRFNLHRHFDVHQGNELCSSKQSYFANWIRIIGQEHFLGGAAHKNQTIASFYLTSY